MTPKADELLALLKRVRANQLRIYLAMGVATACTTAILRHLIWGIGGEALQGVLAYALLLDLGRRINKHWPRRRPLGAEARR